MSYRKLGLILLFAMIFTFAAFIGCNSGSSAVIVSSRAYKGHENDVDVNNLVRVYNALVGTKLDDCGTCHTGEMDGDSQVGNACDWCHELMVHGSGGHTYYETLNPYGKDYMDEGRDIPAIYAIETMDSDGDGYINKTELNAVRHPGLKQSQPGQPVAATIVVKRSDFQAMTADTFTQFLLCNTTKQQFDDYSYYTGVSIKDLLENLGIDLTGANGVTISAPDGFQKTYTIDEVNMNYPDPIYDAGLDVGTLGTECGFVTYPTDIPAGLNDLDTIDGDYYLAIAWMHDGVMMEESYYDPVNGTIEGEGPFRLIVPQEEPGLPDRGSKYSPTNCDDGYDYDPDADHNAGSMVRGAVCIRIDPMPDGVEEWDYLQGGWAAIDDDIFIIYGHNVD